MLDQLHQPPAEIVARAHVNADQYASMYALGRRSRRVLGPARAPVGLDQALRQGQERLLRPPRRLDQMVRRRHAERIANCVDRHLATPGEQTAIIWETDDPNVAAHITYRQLHAQVRSSPTCCKPRRGEGRPGRALPADDPRGRLRHARLRAYRRDPLGRLCRLLADALATASTTGTPSSSSPPTGRRAAAASPRSRTMSTRRSRLPGVASWSCAAPAARGLGRRPRSLAARGWSESRTTARPRRWAPRIRSSSSTPRARPASPRASSTPPAAIWSTPR